MVLRTHVDMIMYVHIPHVILEGDLHSVTE